MNHEIDPRTVHRDKEIYLGDMLRVLLRHARLILGITAASTVIAIVVSLLLPVYYRADTRILPPLEKGNDLAAQLMSQAGGLIALAGGGAGARSQGELYVEMMTSRTVLDRIVDRFALMNLYGAQFREDARTRLRGSVTVRQERKSGVIVLTVEDRDPKRAADLTNAFVEEVRTLAGGLAISEAEQRRLFFEEQIRHTKESLARSEDEIKRFQQRTGALQIDTQAKAVIEGIANLRAMIAAKEVEAKVLRTFATPQNPDLQRTEEEIRALRVESEKLESGKGQGFDPLMSSERVPAMGTEYLRKLRQLKYNETLYELLVKQYELAKLDEAREALVIQVIDRAIPPERKSWPKRKPIVVISTFLGFFLSSAFVLAMESRRRDRTRPSGKDQG